MARGMATVSDCSDDSYCLEQLRLGLVLLQKRETTRLDQSRLARSAYQSSRNSAEKSWSRIRCQQSSPVYALAIRKAVQVASRMSRE